MFGGVIRYSVVMAIGVVGILAACGGSTMGPADQSTAQLAAYYDAYAGRLLGARTQADSIEAAFVEVLNGPIAYGQQPTAVPVRAAGAAQTWFANGVILVDSMRTDSIVVVSLWSDTTVASVVQARSDPLVLPYVSSAIGYATPNIAGLADTAIMTVPTFLGSGACSTTTPVTHVRPGQPTYDPANTTCAPATFVIQGHLHFPAGNAASARLSDVDVTGTTISGVRLQATHGTTFARVARAGHAR